MNNKGDIREYIPKRKNAIKPDSITNNIRCIKVYQKWNGSNWIAYGTFECPICGELFDTSCNSISTLHTTSCGCNSSRHRKKDTDITGQIYNGCKAIKYLKTELGHSIWLWECKCGNLFEARKSAVIYGNTKSCGNCKEYKKDITGLEINGCTAKKFSRKENGRSYWIWECFCGDEFECRQDYIPKSCGKHKETSGERKIRLMLETLGVEFKQYYTGFTDMKDKNILECDFYLPGLNRVIEYDGRQHYESVDLYGGEEGLKSTQHRDQIKNQYCWEHGIDIIRIPYWEYDNFTMEDLVNKYSKFLIDEII